MFTFMKLTASEARLFVRDRAALLLGLVLPAGLLLGLGAIPVLREPLDEFGGVRFIDYFAPSIVVMAVAVIGLTSLPTLVATYRERGVLRRMRTTPVHPGALLGAQLVVSLSAGIISALLVVVVGKLVYDVPVPQHALGFALAFILGMAAVFSLGMLVAALAPNGRTATGIATVLFLLIMFFGGVYLPRTMMPDVLQTIGDYVPPGVQALVDSWNGYAPSALHLLVMGGTTLVVGAASARLFKWE
ncbi:ABC transporter permease [Glycomyces tarimensis]